MKTSIISLAVVFLLCLSCSKQVEVKEQPLLFLPSDLEATLWAESPMFYNPTNMDVDAKGRVWITEAVNYRNYNNDSTRALHHSRGDRVMILEDTDGDGKADASKVFVQDKDLVSPLGIAVIGNKVYVSCSPRLIVYTDNDGDDRPDEKEVLLNGFGGVDHDHSLHAVVGGPDGKLYFNTGNAGPHVVEDKSGWTLRSGSVYTGGSPYNTTNQGNMKSDDGKVWVGGLALRMEPSGKNLRVLAHNFRNAYELAVDSRGDLWQNDNDDQVVACRTTWVMEGGNAGYFSEDGTRSWPADQRPWQDVFTAHWHQDDPGVMPAGDNAGAGSPTGVVVYEGDALGARYRGMLLSADAGRNVIFGYHPEKKGSGYDLGKRMNFITSLEEDNAGYVWNDSAGNAQPDKWFRPSDVAVGTDGALYVADWFDPVVGGHQMSDTTGYGRIYRIVPKGKKLVNPDINLSTINGQMDALRSPAINVRYTGFQLLKSSGPQVIPKLKELIADENPYYHARAIWLLSQLGEHGIAEVEKLLMHEDADIRVVAFRALRATNNDITQYARQLASDPSAWVRREVIVALRDLPLELKKDLLLTLAAGYDGSDRWYLEALGSAMASHTSLFYRELLRLFESETIPPERWNNKVASLVWRLHPPEAVEALKRRASAGNLSDEQRSDALTALAFVTTREAVGAMIALAGNGNREVRDQATYWLTFRQGNEWFSLWDWRKTGIDLVHERAVAAMKVKRNRILDPQMPMDERRRSAREMTKNGEGVRMLLGIVAEGKLPQGLYPFVKELMSTHENESVRIQAATYFKERGEDTPFSAAALSRLEGDITAGKGIFVKHCGSCHSLDPSTPKIGPDLSTIANKFDQRSLLDAIIFPDAGIVFGYEAWTINLTDGRSFFGFLVADGSETVTIKDLGGKNHVLRTSMIRSRIRQEKSLMPSPASLALSEQDIANVSSYLMSR